MTQPKPTIMRSIGRFFGEITKGVRADPGKHTVEVRRESETTTRDTDRGTVTIRRTTIEEVEIDRTSEGGA